MITRIALVIVASALAFTPAAMAAGPASVVMFGESGDFVAPGLRTYEGEQVGLGGSTAHVTVSADGPRQRHFGFDLEFAAAPNHRLARRDYRDAQRLAFRDPGHPGLDVSGDARGCNVLDGRFTVKALGVGAGGAVTRLWVLFEQHCEGHEPALFGEVKIGMSPPAGPLRALPSALRWPDRRAGQRGATVPLTFVAQRAVTPGRSTLRGSGRRAFSVTANRCRGRRLSAGERCRVYVRFAPRRAGAARATLALPGMGPGARIALSGTGLG